MNRRALTIAGLGLFAIVSGLFITGIIRKPGLGEAVASLAKAAPKKNASTATLPPVVSVAQVRQADFTESVVVTGTIVPRDEILVAPEVEGVRVLELAVDEGDMVKAGQVLARLSHETLDAQLAQNDANMARARASMAQARSTIVQSEARAVEARNNFERAKPLKQSGYLSASTYDTRESAAKTADAQLVSSRDGVKLAEAELAQYEAARRELAWKRSNTDVKSPADGLVSRRSARVGGLAAGAGDAMFRIIARGEIELDAEVPESQMVKLMAGQAAQVSVSGVEPALAKVRLVSTEIDKASRLGKVRVFLGPNRAFRIGSFGRAVIETAKASGMAVPVSAVVFSGDTAMVQVLVDDKVVSRAIKVGLTSQGLVEVRDGLKLGDTVVARAGTFLRDGDVVRPVVEPSAAVTVGPGATGPGATGPVATGSVN
jgi:HlyD family secretion protein